MSRPTAARPFPLRRVAGALALAACALTLAGCGERKRDSVAAAETLAEALYPGRLEVHDTRWRLKEDGGYDVIFAVRGDPVTRIRFAVDKDPATCVRGSPCEDKLVAAYEYGVAQGAELKALDAAFRACGVPALEVGRLALQTPRHSPPSVGASLRVATDLTTATRRATEERLTACAAGYARARRDLPWRDRAAFLSVAIIPTARSGPVAPPKRLTFETRAPSGDERAALYIQTLKVEGPEATPVGLRFAPDFRVRQELDTELAAAAKRFLDAQPGFEAARAQTPAFRTTLDPERTDVIRTYVLACANWTGKPPCRSDVAVRMRYDLSARAASELELLRDVRDARGVVTLPPLPGS
ncbi:hypothetical protein ACFQ4O_15140 [Methylopila musalis]|uniref:Lipoprotein n=1 Tax=Methylopila musalis TaxID=1134781 RepID=A0ABW3ZBY2_9HYPH